MSGLFKPKDGDFASLIGKLDAESLEKFTAGSKKPLKEPRSSSPSQPGDFSKNAAANAGPPTAAAHKTSLAENIVIALIFTAVYWGCTLHSSETAAGRPSSQYASSLSASSFSDGHQMTRAGNNPPPDKKPLSLPRRRVPAAKQARNLSPGMLIKMPAALCQTAQLPCRKEAV
jgi:hypothetical protein